MTVYQRVLKGKNGSAQVFTNENNPCCFASTVSNMAAFCWGHAKRMRCSRPFDAGPNLGLSDWPQNSMAMVYHHLPSFYCLFSSLIVDPTSDFETYQSHLRLTKNGVKNPLLCCLQLSNSSKILLFSILKVIFNWSQKAPPV